MGGSLEVVSQRGYTAFTLSLPLAGPSGARTAGRPRRRREPPP